MTPPRRVRESNRLHRFLGSQLEKQNLHNRLFALWASTAIDGLLTAGRRDAIVKEVLAKQQANGGWSLSSLVDCKRQDGTPQETGSDGYATGLAVHVLQLAGVHRDQPPVGAGWPGCAPISRRTATGSLPPSTSGAIPRRTSASSCRIPPRRSRSSRSNLAEIIEAGRNDAGRARLASSPP